MDFSNRPASIDQGGHSSVKIGNDLRKLFTQTPKTVEPGTKGGAKDPRAFALRFDVNMAPSDETKTYYNCTNQIINMGEWKQALADAKSGKFIPTPTNPMDTKESVQPEQIPAEKKKKKKKKTTTNGPISNGSTENIYVTPSGDKWFEQFISDENLSKLPLPEEVVSVIIAARARWTIPLDCSLKITVIMGFRTSNIFIPRLSMAETAPKYGGRIILNLRQRDVYYMMMDGDTKDAEILRTKPNKCFLLNSGEGIMLPPGLCSMTDVWLSPNTKYQGPPSNVIGGKSSAPVSGLRPNNFDRITVVIDLPLSDLLIKKISSEFGDVGGEEGEASSSGTPSGLGNIMKDPKLRGMANSAGIRKKINKDAGIKSAIEDAVRGIKAMAPVEIETEAVTTEDTIDYGLKVIGGKQSLKDAVEAASTKVPEVPVNLPTASQASVASQMSSILGTDDNAETKTQADVLDQMSSILASSASLGTEETTTTSSTNPTEEIPY